MPPPAVVSTVRRRPTANVAVAVLAAVKLITHVPVPEQAPDQPVNDEPPAAAAFNVTVVPTSYTALQVAPQLIPAGALVTLPEPLPALVTVSVGVARKCAVTLCATVSSTWQIPVPLQAPLQPVKRGPAAEAAVSVTTVPSSKSLLQVAPQVTPAGALVTVPVPVPAVATVSVRAGAGVPTVIPPTSSTATHSEAETQSMAVRSVPGTSAPRTAHALASPVGCVDVYAWKPEAAPAQNVVDTQVIPAPRTPSSLVWVHTAGFAVRSVEVWIVPPESSATHNVVDAHDTPAMPLMMFSTLTWVRVQVGAAAVGLTEARTPPPWSPIAHSDAETHETDVRTSPPKGATRDHAAAPPVGFVDATMDPLVSTATHRPVEGHEMAVSARVLSMLVTVHAPAPVGLFDHTRLPVVSTAKHSDAVGHAMPFRACPAAAILVVQLPPATFVVVSARPASSVAAQKLADTQSTAFSLFVPEISVFAHAPPVDV